jgi:hypothetical protein
VGEVEAIAPGTTKAGTFDLAPGRYVSICNLPGRYKLGMAAAFEVLPTAAAPEALPNSGQGPRATFALVGLGGLGLLGLGAGYALRRRSAR